MTTSALIKSARRHAGLTQRELADRIGSHQHEVSEWETGRHEPTGSKILQIVDICQYQLDKCQPEQT